MRIISDFRDYYDCVQKYDQERSLIFIRNSQEPIKTDVSKTPLNDSQLGWYGNFFHKIEYSVLGFAGEIYPHITLSIRHRDTRITEHFCLTFEDVEYIISSEMTKTYIKTWPKSLVKRILKKFFYINEGFKQFFEEGRVPIWLISGSQPHKFTIELNPCLNELQFFRIVNTTQCYQYLSTYLNNVAQSEPKIPALSNDDMILSKGHDLKTSFRKPSSK